MKYYALSIVSPNGTKIANGDKNIEVRSWIPTIPFDQDLLIIENEIFLKEDLEEDPNGTVVALVKIRIARSFAKEDISAACASYWCEGYYSWELYDVRKISYCKKVPAKKGIYEIDLDLSK